MDSSETGKSLVALPTAQDGRNIIIKVFKIELKAGHGALFPMDSRSDLLYLLPKVWKVSVLWPFHERYKQHSLPMESSQRWSS